MPTPAPELNGSKPPTEDPAHTDDSDEGWTSEGGATPSGPATDTDNADESGE